MINWGRIVKIFVLAIDVQHSRVIDLQLDTALFIEANLSERLIDQGGWNTVVPVFDVLSPTTSVIASSSPISTVVITVVTTCIATFVAATVLLHTI